MFSLISVHALGQKADTVYYYTDAKMKPVKQAKAKNVFKLYQTDQSDWSLVRFNDKGVIQLKETYTDSLLKTKHGAFMEYRYGKPYIKGRYFNNLKQGNFISYDTTGVVEEVSLYSLDTLKNTLIYWLNGGKREERIYGTITQDIERFVYYTNGNLAIKQIITFNNKVIEGEYFDKNGKPAKLSDIETPPIFPGGMQKFYAFIANNLRYPTDASMSNTQGTVKLSFLITKTGEITDIKVVQSVDSLLNSEAIRVLKSSPRWMPGKLSGENISMRYTLPISFSRKDF